MPDAPAAETACPAPFGAPPATPPVRLRTVAALRFFQGRGWPHCAAAVPFVDWLERIEIRADPAGRVRFEETVPRLGITSSRDSDVRRR